MEIASIFNRTALVQILAGMAQESPLTEAERRALGGAGFQIPKIEELSEGEQRDAFVFARKVAMSDPDRFLGGLEEPQERRLGAGLMESVRERVAKNYLEYDCSLEGAVELVAEAQGVTVYELVVECMPEDMHHDLIREWLDKVRP